MAKAKAIKKAIKSSKGKGAVGTAINVGKALLGGKGKGSKRKKRGAFWYAREIQRLKLKRRYEKIRLGVLR